MLQSMGLQRVGYNLVIEQQQHDFTSLLLSGIWAVSIFFTITTISTVNILRVNTHGHFENKFSEMKIMGKVMNILAALVTNCLTEWLYPFIFTLLSINVNFTSPYQCHGLEFLLWQFNIQFLFNFYLLLTFACDFQAPMSLLYDLFVSFAHLYFIIFVWT